MFLLVEFRLLDFLTPGTHYNRPGYDFFSIPKKYLSIIHQTGFRDVEGARYRFHPALSLLLGSWLSLFPPWGAYSIFVMISVFILFVLAKQAASLGNSAAWKLSSPVWIFCSMPVYLMLWNAQPHVLCMAGCGFVFYALQKKIILSSDKNTEAWFCWGVALSLFSKPLILIAVPVLLLDRSLRKPLLGVLLLYLLLSFATLEPAPSNAPRFAEQALGLREWLIHGDATFLNRFNFLSHWTWIVTDLVAKDYFINYDELFSLPSLFRTHFAPHLKTSLPFLILYLPIPLLAFIRRPKLNESDETLILTILAISSHFLCYTSVWEFHYVSLQGTIPFLFWLAFHQEDRWDRRLLVSAGLLCLLLLLPTPFFLIRDPVHWTGMGDLCIKLSRVIPAIGVYGALITLLLRRQLSSSRATQ